MEQQFSRTERIRRIREGFLADEKKYVSRKKSVIALNGEKVYKQTGEKKNKYMRGLCLRFFVSILLFLSMYLGKVKLEEIGKHHFAQVKTAIASNNLLEPLEKNAQKIVEENIIPVISKNGMLRIKEGNIGE